MTNQNIQTTLVISHPTDHKALAIQEENGWFLPKVEGGPIQDEIVSPLQQAVKQQLGWEVAIGRQLYKKKDNELVEYIYEAQLLYPLSIHTKFEWLGKEDRQRLILQEAYKSILNEWFAENHIPGNRAKWFQSNFYNRVEEWVTKEVKRAGLSVNGKFEQVKASDFCLIHRIPTNEGDLYYKATGSAAKHEAALSKHLDIMHPGKSTEIVAAQESEGWLLMKDVEGEALRNVKDKQLWQRAIREYAELQVMELDKVNTLLSIGVPDRRMSVLKEEIQQHLAEMCATGLSAAETEQVMALQPELLVMCDELGAILPPSIDHGDLHTNNIRLVNGDLVFFDWGDAAVSHPFFSTRIFWHALDDLIGDESEWLGMVDEFRPYYLEPWTKFAPMEKLEKALRISDELACVQRALSWHLYLTPSRENKAESFKRPSQWLQLLLEHRALVGK